MQAALRKRLKKNHVLPHISQLIYDGLEAVRNLLGVLASCDVLQHLFEDSVLRKTVNHPRFVMQSDPSLETLDDVASIHPHKLEKPVSLGIEKA